MDGDKKKAMRLAKRAVEILETDLGEGKPATFHDKKAAREGLAAAFDEIWKAAKHNVKQDLEDLISAAEAFAEYLGKDPRCDHEGVGCGEVGCPGERVEALRSAIEDVKKNWR